MRAIGTGVYHCGVEVYKKELDFSSESRPGCINDSGIAVSWNPGGPKQGFTHRQRIEMGFTRRSEEEIKFILRRMASDWRADSYDAVDRNSCHFANEFIHSIGLGEIPDWLLAPSRTAAAFRRLSLPTLPTMPTLPTPPQTLVSPVVSSFFGSWMATASAQPGAAGRGASVPASPSCPTSITATTVIPFPSFPSSPSTQPQPQTQQQQQQQPPLVLPPHPHAPGSPTPSLPVLPPSRKQQQQEHEADELGSRSARSVDDKTMLSFLPPLRQVRPPIARVPGSPSAGGGAHAAVSHPPAAAEGKSSEDQQAADKTAEPAPAPGLPSAVPMVEGEDRRGSEVAQPSESIAAAAAAAVELPSDEERRAIEAQPASSADEGEAPIMSLEDFIRMPPRHVMEEAAEEPKETAQLSAASSSPALTADPERRQMDHTGGPCIPHQRDIGAVPPLGIPLPPPASLTAPHSHRDMKRLAATRGRGRGWWRSRAEEKLRALTVVKYEERDDFSADLPEWVVMGVSSAWEAAERRDETRRRERDCMAYLRALD
ncbi:unnamed protein product [Vitrella brassicaformis CCMP3155]|uniref:PPPDE domain-containing protein n=1 Tax=Vitrella brassicaformis (strain CCMP3155) TaxID=1169540 RepID=A0A0G4G9Z8_VITBC|nr:unnamed protein product [Vitrella brassicaformis CCMP3155]|eukprot:CEM25770.1 unnamed protein product [Vitrella brassicaformis CCMP3155]